jgi:hypothetical protein
MFLWKKTFWKKKRFGHHKQESFLRKRKRLLLMINVLSFCRCVAFVYADVADVVFPSRMPLLLTLLSLQVCHDNDKLC